LGGDHSLAAGSVAASAAWARARGGKLGLIWVDAHGDMNTPTSTSSGNVHGMPLAALLGSEPSELAGIGGFAPKVDPGQTVLIGVRNLDEEEKDRVRASRIHVFTMKDIDRAGIAHVIEQAIELAGRDAAGIHVSFDLDVCDPAIAPGVGTPVKGGLDYREGHMVMEVLADSGRLLALDMVEVNPTLDVRNSTAELGTELILSALGRVWRTGADAATTLTTSKDLVIGGTTVPAGKVTLYTLPGEDQWKLILNKQTGQWGTEYDQSKDLARVDLTKKTLSAPVDQLTIALEPGAGNEGMLKISWETTELSVPFTVKG